MRWVNFRHAGKLYSLAHLHPFSFDVKLEATGPSPERNYRIHVEFSLHCFTRGPKRGELVPENLAYRDSRETRIFDFLRHEHSQLLPDIIRGLAERKCFHDKHGNFYVFEIIDENNTKSYYSVFFTLSKKGKGEGLTLFVSSAHMRPERPYAKNTKPVRFRVIVHNTWTGKALRPAP